MGRRISQMLLVYVFFGCLAGLGLIFMALGSKTLLTEKPTLNMFWDGIAGFIGGVLWLAAGYHIGELGDENALRVVSVSLMVAGGIIGAMCAIMAFANTGLGFWIDNRRFPTKSERLESLRGNSWPDEE